MSVKDNVENHPVWWSMVMIIAGFVSGVGAVKMIMEISGQVTVREEYVGNLLREIDDQKQMIETRNNLIERHVGELQNEIQAHENTTETKNHEIERLVSSLELEKAKAPRQHWINISQIEGDNESSVRAVIKVNGASYSYPTPAVWAELPGRIAEKFPLPYTSEEYHVAFDIISSSGKRYTNATPIRVRHFPYNGVFEAFAEHVVEVGGRSSSTSWPSDQRRVVNSVVRIHFEIE